MSLIHWWPLNGNITDNGADNFTLSATPSFSAAGKIGKCATNTNISAGLTYLSNQTLPLAKDSPISIFTWVYMNDYSTTGANLNGLVSNHNHGHNSDTGSGFGLNLRNNGNSFQVSISTSSTDGRTFSTYCGNTTFNAGEWHHVGFTYNGSRINFYLDGKYDGGLNFTSSYNSNNPIGIFCWSTGYSGYSSSCQLNDVRIYNHALSTKEVKEISKGLVLHYNFEDEEIETTRKVYDSSGYGYNGTNNGVTLSNDSSSGRFSAKFASNAYIEIPSLPQFDKVTYSMWVKIPSNTNAYRSIFIPKGNPTGGGIWLSVNTEGVNLWAYQGGNAPNYCKGASTLLSADTWYLYTHTFDGTTGKNYLNGVAVGSAATYTTRTYIPSGVYTLGDSYTGTSWNGTPFDGKIADFKIYATALSAADILAEYNRKAAIDKNGNLFTGEIIETGWSGTTILTLSDIFNTNAVYVDKTSWADTIMDVASVNVSFQPATTYYIRYRVQRLAYPVSHSYTTQAWAKTMLYNGSSSIDCAQLSQTAYISMVPGECKWVTGSFTTPSSLSNWRMLFYSARWSGSSSDWGTNAEVETVRLSDFYISTAPFAHTNVSIEKENLIYSAEIHELSDSIVKIFKNGELRASSVEEL